MQDILEVNKVHQGDSLDLVKRIKDESAHLILSDIPYGIGIAQWDVLHENGNSAYLGSSPAQNAAGSVFKSRAKPINGWSAADRAIPREYQDWCAKWASDWYRILKPGASAFIFAGRRLAHRCAIAMEDSGFNLKDEIAWIKPNAPYRAQRLNLVYERRGDMVSACEWENWRIGNLRPVFEPIMWFVKPYPVGTTISDNVIQHGVGAYHDKAFAEYSSKRENVIHAGIKRWETGHHPTQKPIELMKSLIELTTKEGHLVLDPFCGSGSTLLAAKQCSRDYLGIEMDHGFFEAAQRRLEED